MIKGCGCSKEKCNCSCTNCQTATNTMSSVPMSSVPMTMVPMTMVPMTMVPMSMVPMTMVPMSMDPMSMDPMSMDPKTMDPKTMDPMKMPPMSMVPMPMTSMPCLPKAMVGRRAPDFSAPVFCGKSFKDMKLSDCKGKWVVLLFYPSNFSFVCPTEICSLSDCSDKFKSLNCEVIACSAESKFSNREFSLKPREEGGLYPCSIPLLSDPSREISRDYGVLIDQGPSKGLCYRGTFIIDPSCMLRHSSISDLPVGRNVDEILRILQAFQVVEKCGEVCPSKWRPGDMTIVTDPESEKTKKYFKDQLPKK